MLEQPIAAIRQRYSMKTIFWFCYSLLAVLWIAILSFVDISAMSKLLVFFMAMATMFVLLFPYIDKSQERTDSEDSAPSAE